MRNIITTAVPIATFVGVILGFFAWHYDTVNDLRSDYSEKLNAVEREKEDAVKERDLYFNYLVSIPGSLVQLQKEIDQQKQKNFDLEKKIENQIIDTEEPYSKEAFIRKGSSFTDEKTKLLVGLLDVYRDNNDVSQAVLKFSLPTGQQSQLVVTTGDSFLFTFEEKEFRLSVISTNWYGDSVDVSVSENLTQKIQLVKKKYLFEE